MAGNANVRTAAITRFSVSIRPEEESDFRLFRRLTT
jgi:hypothetical protein